MRINLKIYYASVLISTFVGFSALSAQTVIENPATPLARNAGRVLQLEEIWRITDESGEFYLKHPGNLKYAADGSFFLTDEGQFLHFTAEAKFIKNIFKKGQGPGEIQQDFEYQLQGLEVFVIDYWASKMFRMDFDGNYLGSIGPPGKTRNDFLGVVGDDLVIMESEWPPAKNRTGKEMDILHRYKFLSKDGRTEKEIYTFMQVSFLGPGYGRSMGASVAALDEGSQKIFACYGQEYRIDVLDIATSKIVITFRRKYPRIIRVENERIREFEKKYNMPKLEYEFDIRHLQCFSNRVWVMTSTSDKEKGSLYDIFDFSGRYLDCFYLGGNRILLSVRGDFIFINESDTEGINTVAKYRIIG